MMKLFRRDQASLAQLEPQRAPLVRQPDGAANDDLDALAFENHYEDPERYENAIDELVALAATDPDIDKLLLQIKMHPDRARVFQMFIDSGVPDAVLELMRTFGVTKQQRICDVGCGPGQMAWALSERGFQNVSAMDPNGTRLTGTGYLSEIAGNRITITNDLNDWMRGGRDLDAVHTAATVHHWQHIPQISLMLRRNLKPGGLWFCIREFVANTPQELHLMLNNHLLWNRLQTYEWPYPATAYVDLIASAGFELIAVVPQFYSGNAIAGTTPAPPAGVDLGVMDHQVSNNLRTDPYLTVEAFWDEVDHFRRACHGNRIYTRPQAFVFRRIAS